MATSLNEVHLSDERVQEILTIAKEWCLSNGVGIKSGYEDPESSKVSCAPFSLFPSIVPSAVISKAKATMPHFNRLMHQVAMDHQFLEESLKNVIGVDEFMLNLWNIYNRVIENGIKQPIMLGMFRNDFMINCKNQEITKDKMNPDNLQLKQIEFNTIASSFAGLTQKIGDLHRLTLGLAGKQFTRDQVPTNLPASSLASGLAKAWELYNNPKAVIVFIVSNFERNVIDQRALEFGVYKRNPLIRVLRKTMSDVEERGSLDEDSRLFVDGDEVAVLYLRDGYTVENYPSQKEWDGRLKMELSCAIKCPSVQYQLAGAKKIQQELARPGALERFIDDPNIVKDIRSTFADQYSLDLGPEGDHAITLALASPDKFVLKPQREGGGHNRYGDDIVKFLSEVKDSKERNAYILMERIFPLQQQNYLCKQGVPFCLSTVISELGIYGVYIGTNDLEELDNRECGHMMRTKISGTDEGGITAGFAVLDTPFVVKV